MILWPTCVNCVSNFVVSVCSTAPCGEGNYTCFNRKCIRLSEVCDGQDDCGDNSDENYLHGRCPGVYRYSTGYLSQKTMSI